MAFVATRVETLMRQHGFIDRGGAKIEPVDLRFRLYSIGTQSNLLLEVGSRQGIRILLSTTMEPLIERLNASGEIAEEESKDFYLTKDPSIKFEIERRREPYWWIYKVGDFTETTLLKAIDLYKMIMELGREIPGKTPV
ncbi:MAG: hypothetical protein LUP95_00670 [Euryarchaeota archaeon]|nr:hypothetical protein [Euryarchaeota archaeon]